MKLKEFDVVVFGATSFVGQILVQYLWKRHGLNGELKWAIAGRDQAKLEILRNTLGEQARTLPILTANASNEEELQGLSAKARVIVSTVGPYALYGSQLVKICAESGTDYCDLTGEVQWIARMIDAHEASAKKSGARIVHCCGFDSIPSDLGVLFLQNAVTVQYGEPCQQIRMRVRKLKGEFSGGTVASMINVTREVAADRSLAKKLANPYLISPTRLAARQPNVKFAEFDPIAKNWLAPFVMAGINTRIVHRSNALMGYNYGKDFKYDEAMMTGSGLKGRLTAIGLASGMAGFLIGAALPPTRWILEKYVVPKPGEGPSENSQKRGSYDLRFYGTTSKGKSAVARVTGDMDPGYGSTAKMLGEAVVCLAKDNHDKAGGFWTPASLMGEQLISRLQLHAGLTFELLES
ncbi:saccharopine dehydrogenase family protein [Limnobacter parvus]|uniref:Saccharopine dehydrogenase NADP-binding domain-containing protein n=1 Tax=Limnobacter parvus TaxID=2939690 RepID=A0ABT1XK39_9BURK|nr:saccharopine dehydrogenase NADP-binding domain-containing protein [Limnobacter parvus]MCR2747658.1 saccharopine dehydrogenase NADP-binding domain-containing protein [Limnobacter parvus]